ncbi:MAG: DUF2461 domain-containing protein [Alloprevotella sp.]|nr:DUF2461 domain-containing protein [Alloprevotella sp.]
MNDYYVGRLYRFFEELAANNTREWLAANRSRYDELRQEWMDDLGRLLTLCRQWEPATAPLDPKRASYRFARDTRFSPDKTPYKTFFSAAFGPKGRQEPYAGYYIQLGLPRLYDSGLYGGLYAPPAPILRKLRHTIIDNIEEFEEIISAPELNRLYPDWCGERLKTIPKGWDRDHPQAPLLRLKEYGRFMPAGPEWFDDPSWPEKTADALRPLKPLIDFLNYSIDE